MTGARELHQRAVLASEGGRPARARRLLQQAAALDDPDPVLRVRILVSLALAESETGDLDAGLAVLDSAAAALGDIEDAQEQEQVSGLVHGQRGLLLLRAGRFPESVAELDVAARALRWSPQEQARALLNRGTAALMQGDLKTAADSLQRSRTAAAEANWHVGEAKAAGNLGYLAHFTGDLPEALRLSDEAAVVLAPLGSGVEGVGRINRAHILIAAGLHHEADAELTKATELLSAARLTQDLAEAELNRAEVAMLLGRPAEARRWARRARRRFTARGAETWAQQCMLIELEANVAEHTQLARTAAEAEALIDLLREQGRAEEARKAHLIALDARLATGTPVLPPALQRSERIGTRLLARAVRAGRAEQQGDTRTAARERSRGLVELHRYQSRFGSLDMQSGASGLGRRLAADGLAAALRTGRPSQVLAWSERARATTSRTPALRPPADPLAAELLAELRFVRTTIRETTLGGGDERALRRLQARRRELESAIRRRSWYAEGAGEIEAPADLSRLRETLTAARGSLVTYFSVDSQLHALVVTPRRTTLHHLGDADAISERVQRLRADLDQLALARLPAPMRDVVTRSLRTGLRAVQESVWSPLAQNTGPDAGPLVIVPSAAVAALPWTSLPALRSRPVTVAPSATWWLAARSRGTGVPSSSSAVFVSGPDVARGPAEVSSAAERWAGSTLLTGEDATGAKVLEAADGADLWHIAAHGTHDGENPLFSALHLSDGPLFGYDLDALKQVPRHVVLSACDLGLATVRQRDEALGMTAALLHAGAVSVVAGMARVGDEAAFEVGARLHDELQAGRTTADALAAALDGAGDDEPVPLVCLGAGW
ncbi:MAG TPA: CHAT domain-containing protein [Actinomycetales bacterium]|nr:CHAT domain-containing protein [Actinomycetales bacterium]